MPGSECGKFMRELNAGKLMLEVNAGIECWELYARSLFPKCICPNCMPELYSRNVCPKFMPKLNGGKYMPQFYARNCMREVNAGIVCGN